MNLVDLIGFNGIIQGDLDKDTKVVLDTLIKRLEDFRVQIFDQLRSQPQIFYTDPTTTDGAKKVAGANAGDIAVWKGADGMDHWQLLGTTPPQAASPSPTGANLTAEKASLALETSGGARSFYIRDGRLTDT